MIQAVQLRNFLSHKNTFISLHEGLNVIVGPTDSGKSAVVRAVNWVLNNRPTGDSFRSKWGGDTRVDLHLDDCKVARVKTDTKNLYIIDADDGGYYEEFEGFGQKVPEEISTLLKISSLSIQAQFDPHFLLTSSAGEVASHFNEVAHLSKIDTSIKNVNSWARKVNQDLHYSQEHVSHLEQDLAELQFVEELDDMVTNLEKVESKRSDTESKITSINRQINLQQTVSESMQELQSFLTIENHVESALVIQEQINSIQAQQKELSSLIRSLKTLEKVKVENTEFLKLENLVSLYNKVQASAQVIEDRKKKVSDTLTNYFDVIRWKENAEGALKILEERYHEQAPEECPLCGNKMK